MLITVVVFILILGVSILVHEFGHFITAKRAGVLVEEFGVGMPPRIFGKKIGETIYSINLIPVGGFVKLHGEEGAEPSLFRDPKSFVSKPILTRAVIISAGVIMNVFLAATIFYFLLGFSGFQTQQPLIFDYQFPFGQQKISPIVSFISDNSPAAKSGFQPFDIIISGNDTEFKNSEHFVQFINENKGRETTFKVENFFTKEIKYITATPRVDFSENEGSLGVGGLRDVVKIQYMSGLEKATVGFLHSFNLSHYSIVALGKFIKASIDGRTIEPLASTVVGPVGILAITKLTIATGIISLLNLTALIALALAIVNILPFPALDGGRLVFIGFEFLTRRKVPPRVEKNINIIGFTLLIILFVLVAYKDILQFKDVLF